MAENFSELVKDINLEVQQVQPSPNRTIPRYFIVKLPQKKKKKILRAARENVYIIYGDGGVVWFGDHYGILIRNHKVFLIRNHRQ